jgi:hypothetical protein
MLEKSRFKFLTQEYILLKNVPPESDDEESVNSDEDPNFQLSLMIKDIPVSEASDDKLVTGNQP